MLNILLVLSDRPITICCLFRLSALHSAPTAAALQLLRSGTLSLFLRLFEGVLGLILFVVISRPTFSSRPPNPLGAFLLATQIRLPLTTVRVINYISLLTYLVSLRKELPIKANFILVILM